LPAVNPRRALLDTLAAAMRAYADFTLRRCLIWDAARKELAVTIAYGFDPSCVEITLRGGALDPVFDMVDAGQTLCSDALSLPTFYQICALR
jgi:hypothetical protein